MRHCHHMILSLCRFSITKEKNVSSGVEEHTGKRLSPELLTLRKTGTLSDGSLIFLTFPTFFLVGLNASNEDGWIAGFILTRVLPDGFLLLLLKPTHPQQRFASTLVPVLLLCKNQVLYCKQHFRPLLGPVQVSSLYYTGTSICCTWTVVQPYVLHPKFLQNFFVYLKCSS
jgi:hypothetical protein